MVVFFHWECGQCAAFYCKIVRFNKTLFTSHLYNKNIIRHRENCLNQIESFSPLMWFIQEHWDSNDLKAVCSFQKPTSFEYMSNAAYFVPKIGYKDISQTVKQQCTWKSAAHQSHKSNLKCYFSLIGKLIDVLIYYS